MKPKLLIVDVDGILTDGTKIYDQDHQVIAKRFADQDFTAIKLFKERGWSVCFLSSDEFNKRMADHRDIDFFCSRNNDGSIDKARWLSVLLEKYDIAANNTIYIGDDTLDDDIIIELTKLGGEVYCPSNACPYIKRLCGKKNVLKTPGGSGVLKELYNRYFNENYSLRKYRY